MSGTLDDSSRTFGPGARFQKTLWPRVLAAGKQDSPESQEAMAALYQAYSLPIYSFLRRSGHNRQKAKELAHDFFGYLWEHNLVAKADPNRKFRNFLIGVLKKFVLNQHKQPIGRRYQFISIDAEAAEGIYANEPSIDETPETLFERDWVLATLAQARERLRQEFLKTGTTEQFEAVLPFLTGDKDERIASLAAKLGKNEGATRTFLTRLRAEHRELILHVISDTLANKEEAETEFAYFKEVLRRVV